MRTQQSGFTLVELIMVIVIIGILAAAALPRFANLQGDARHAKGQAILGSVRSASNIAHAQALARNIVNGNITMEDTNVAMVSGYPAASGGILAAANINAATDDVTTTLSGGTQMIIQINGAQNPANCQITYTEGTPPTITYNGSADNCL
ncbi:MSHA pilin protein MshA [Sulfuritortus calidifontis]|uniref:MSHA pilin protein MshA n=1 Tax=Sulfuritortus calidifontis TaxID=1914471 RepID=A0A4R3JX44_9PROT|nr:type II secretion system protein [Sulfuritortus calidifontis]TCS71886.1 MSHA pilin protein MshA [Sulfuritortus calidifontis]